MLICDTSALVAYFDSNDAHHREVSSVVDADPGPFVVSPYVVAELDYLLATRRGVDAELVALAELGGGAWDMPCLEPSEMLAARELINRYRDQDIGLADASLVILAARYRTDRLLTLDHRHFRVIRTLNGKAFSIQP